MAKKSAPRKAGPRRTRSARAPAPEASSSAPGSAPSTPEKFEGIDREGKLEEATLRRFVFQTFGRARRTQDSPVMPDVWLRYIRVAEDAARRRATSASGVDTKIPSDDGVDLLLTPLTGTTPGYIAERLRGLLKKDDR